MTLRSRESRRIAARQRDRSQNRWVLPAAGLVIAAVAVIAVLVGMNASGSGTTPSASPVAVGPPTITGAALPRFTQTIGDPAKGMIAPVVTGQDYRGQPVAIQPTGRPQLVIFAAHWCPHCQVEVPRVQAWVDAGKAPSDVDIRLVSTAVDPAAPNYPPEAWLEQVGWSSPVIVDTTSTAGDAYGVSAYPFFTLLDGQGKVLARMSGEIPVSELESLLAAVPRS